MINYRARYVIWRFRGYSSKMDEFVFININLLEDRNLILLYFQDSGIMSEILYIANLTS